jgi:hypothetical protein
MELNMGSCTFCGKTMMIESSSKLDEAQANELATHRCDCEQAQRKREFDAAFEKIETLFGGGAYENGFTRESRNVMALIASLAKMVDERQISECVVTLKCGDKAKLVKKNGVVKITRTRKIEQTEDVE